MEFNATSPENEITLFMRDGATEKFRLYKEEPLLDDDYSAIYINESYENEDKRIPRKRKWITVTRINMRKDVDICDDYETAMYKFKN